METVDSRERGWKLTTQKSKQDTDSNYMKVLDYALTKERTRNIKIGVAGMNLFTVGFAYELAHERGVLESGGVEFEMLTGMASPQSKAVAEDTGHLLFYVPVVNPEEYDVAIAYLVRRLEENSLDQNFMSDIFDLDDANVLHKEEQRFRRALARVYDVEVGPVRQQNRLTETAEDIKSFVQKDGEWTFENTRILILPYRKISNGHARSLRRFPIARLGLKRSRKPPFPTLMCWIKCWQEQPRPPKCGQLAPPRNAARLFTAWAC